MWTPLLSGKQKDRAIGDGQAIARALMALSSPEDYLPRYASDSDVSVGSGVAGLAVSLAALAGCGIAPDAGDRALELLEVSTQAMASVEMDASLYGGYSGIAWAFSRLSIPSGSPAEDDELSEVDTELATLLSESPWTRDYDLISGLAGMGVYALERLPRPTARKCLEQIVDRLEETAERRDGGLTWHTDPNLLTEYQLRTTPDGYYNLGLAHGVPGVVGLLGQICAAGILVERSRDLLDGAVAWMLNSSRPGDVSFPYWTGPGLERSRTRLAWCYGDPGVAAALLVAGRCVQEPAWERHAIEIALRSASRPAGDAGVVDASLCHGAAGLGHIYNRIYQRTGNEEIRAAAVTWIEAALGMRQPGAGIAGYTTALKNLDGVVTWEADPSFLTGAAGIALAFAAAATPVEPDWDRVLLLSSRFER